MRDNEYLRLVYFWLLHYGYYQNNALNFIYKHCVPQILIEEITDDTRPLDDYFCHCFNCGLWMCGTMPNCFERQDRFL